MIINLTQKYIDTGLVVPEGHAKVELVDDTRSGLYILVSAMSPGQGTYFWRTKNYSGISVHLKIGKTTDISLAAARAEVKKLRAEQSLGMDHHSERKKQKAVLTFSEFMEQHYLPYVKPRKRSWSSDESLYRVHLKEAFGKKKLNQISRQQIQAFHTALKETGRAAATVNHTVKLLKHSLNLAINWNLLEGVNPASHVPLFFEDNKKEDYLSDAQLEKFMHVLRTHPNRSICQLALALISTGCRLNELLSAKWTDVQMDKGIILIRASNAKSKKARVVPINATMLGVLNQLGTEGKYAYLFINKKTGNPYVNVSKPWHTLRKAAGLDHLTLHQLRHNFASFLVNSGRPIYEFKQLLGHADIKTTERYAHLSTKTLQAASDSASVIIRGAMQPKLVEQVEVLPAMDSPVREVTMDVVTAK